MKWSDLTLTDSNFVIPKGAKEEFKIDNPPSSRGTRESWRRDEWVWDEILGWQIHCGQCSNAIIRRAGILQKYDETIPTSQEAVQQAMYLLRTAIENTGAKRLGDTWYCADCAETVEQMRKIEKAGEPRHSGIDYAATPPKHPNCRSALI